MKTTFVCHVAAALAVGCLQLAAAPGCTKSNPTEAAATPAPSVPKDVAAPPKDAKRTASGLAIKVLKAGKGSRHPGPTAEVTVHYSGWTTDGKMFDSSVVRGEPATFPLNGVIAGWTEGVQLMREGERSRLWIPAELAYGNQPGRPAGMLVFDIELLRIH